MYNTTPQRTTTLGLPEVAERVGAYLFLWVGALLLLIFERNPTVRHHAKQSLVIFGLLSILLGVLGLLSGAVGWVPLIGWLLSLPFSILIVLDKAVIIVAWLGLMLAAAVSPGFVAPGTRRLTNIFS